MLQLYIVSQIVRQCALVKAGDRLGIYLEELPWAIAYKFAADSPRALQYRAENITHPFDIFENVIFDPLTFPYNFSVLAYFDTGTESLRHLYRHLHSLAYL